MKYTLTLVSLFLLVSLVTVPMISSVTARGDKPSPIPTTIFDATILIQYSEGKHPAGTGFFVDEDKVLTAKHVVSTPVAYSILLDGQSYEVTHIYEALVHDVAILTVRGVKYKHPLKLGKTRDIEVGRPFWIVGFPHGVQEVGDMGFFGENNHVGQVAVPGHSGAPIVDTRTGKVLGIMIISVGGYPGIIEPGDALRSAFKNSREHSAPHSKK